MDSRELGEVEQWAQRATEIIAVVQNTLKQSGFTDQFIVDIAIRQALMRFNSNGQSGGSSGGGGRSSGGSGNVQVEVGGKTYDSRDALKKLGLHFDGDSGKKVWIGILQPAKLQELQALCTKDELELTVL